jgi:hypothetical protein
MGIRHLTDKDDIFNKDYLIGRPMESFGLPIGLYHPVFNEFQQNFMNKQIEDISAEFDDESLLAQIHELHCVASNFYKSESKRSDTLRPTLDWLLDVTLVDRYANLEESGASDGIVEVYDRDVALGISCIEEENNEIGLGDCDPSLSAGRSYLKRWSQTTCKYDSFHT